jgi:hypothetical protein
MESGLAECFVEQKHKVSRTCSFCFTMRSVFRFCTPLILASAGCLSYVVLARAASPDIPPPAANDPGEIFAEVRLKADAALARPDLTAYRGWIKFLRYEANTAAARSGAASDAAQTAAHRLDEWVGQITADPRALAALRGVQEWAYESPVDGSGQPFKLAIPTDYDPAHPAALSVRLHGYAGNHLEFSTDMAAHPGVFDLAVLGRSRGGGYRALSEADVLQVIDYVQAHWAIDPDRVRLNGDSMGGGGTYRLGARYPQRWASARPRCGFASYVPVGNLLTLPIYAIHSADDWTVSVLHDRGPLLKLRELGGQVIYDETNGYGHAVWTYPAGSERSSAWEQRQVRPDSRTERHIDYTALDGGAVRGWWGEVVEWGDAPKPARFVLTAGQNNLLFAGLTNIRRLRLRLAESPFDRAQPLQVSVNGAVPITLRAPLPASVVLACGDKAWSFETGYDAPPFHLHTPGGASLLYDGEPLLIVYGTRGGDAERQALRAAAEAASKSPNPAWVDDRGEAGADGVPHNQNLYGRLNIKADTEVTGADLARCHLVLIGTAAQNAVVARLADQLPVCFADGAVTCSDGVKFPGRHHALGLVYYNPLAPDRLIFWVASDDPATYAANSIVPAVMAGGTAVPGSAVGIDFLVMDATAPALVAARSFDSRWRWTPGREVSPPWPASLKTHQDFSVAMGAAIRRATDADFALVGSYGPAAQAAVTAGTTRVCDMALRFYYLPIGVCEMSGTEILEVDRRADAAKDALMLISRSPQIGAGKIQASRVYRVALPIDVLWTLSELAKMAPRPYRQTDLFVGDALERFVACEY